MKRLMYVAALVAFIAGPAHALDSVTVKERLGVDAKSIKESEIPGLFEVVSPDNRVLYMDATGRYILVGNLYDTFSRVNLTQKRVDELTQVDFSALPLEKAVVMGEGSKKLAVFSDPDCPYCRKAHPELKQLKDTQVYVFLFPLDMHKDAYGKSRKIWCAEDRIAALDEAMDGGSLEKLEDCDEGSVIDEVKELALKVGVRSTPSLILQTGQMVRGFKPAAELQKDIDAAADDALKGEKEASKADK